MVGVAEQPAPVWLATKDGCYVPAMRCGANTLRLEDGTGTTRTLAPKERTLERDPLAEALAPDLRSCVHKNEAELLHRITARFNVGEIYTFAGEILVAVNPYRRLDIYTQEAREAVAESGEDEAPPHVYFLAERAYRRMLRDKKDQSVLISGDSGAGKTETTKYILEYLAGRARGGPGAAGASVRERILASNPILEAFGNARTCRNSNSSRFGKFIRIWFDPAGRSITGAHIDTYLLEKCRVAGHAPGERNFHAFYQLLAGGGPALLADLGLDSDDPASYRLLAGATGESRTAAERAADAAAFGRTAAALEAFGLGEGGRREALRALAAVLRLGNARFEAGGGDACAVPPDALRELEAAAGLLRLPGGAAALQEALTVRRATAGGSGGSSFTRTLSPREAGEARDSLCMALYAGLFRCLAARVNAALAPGGAAPAEGDWSAGDEEAAPGSSGPAIGILDIFGFECMEMRSNGFEQLCINYANEKLQQHFNESAIAGQQLEYVREGIQWEATPPPATAKACAELLERPGAGLVALLEEQCGLPGGSDKALAEKLHAAFGEHGSYARARFAPSAFALRHYAGEVTYDTAGFVARNRDAVSPEILALLRSSDSPLLRAAARAAERSSTRPPPGAGGARPGPTKARALSVFAQFRAQLESLLRTIAASDAHFVRCMKPCAEPAEGSGPAAVQAPLLLHQMRCSGLVEAVRVAAAAYAASFPHADFLRRYRPVLPRDIAAAVPRPGAPAPPAPGLVQRALAALEAAGMPRAASGRASPAWQLGKTRVFVQERPLRWLEGRLAEARGRAAALVQRNVRMWIACCEADRRWEALVILQAAIRAAVVRREVGRLRERRREAERNKRRRTATPAAAARATPAAPRATPASQSEKAAGSQSSAKGPSQAKCPTRSQKAAASQPQDAAASQEEAASQEAMPPPASRSTRGRRAAPSAAEPPLPPPAQDENAAPRNEPPPSTGKSSKASPVRALVLPPASQPEEPRPAGPAGRPSELRRELAAERRRRERAEGRLRSLLAGLTRALAAGDAGEVRALTVELEASQAPGPDEGACEASCELSVDLKAAIAAAIAAGRASRSGRAPAPPPRAPAGRRRAREEPAAEPEAGASDAGAGEPATAAAPSGSAAGPSKVVLCISGADDATRKKIVEAARAVGGARISHQKAPLPGITHVATVGSRRTYKVLFGIARGAALVRHEWVLESAAAGRWLDPAPYANATFRAPAPGEDRRLLRGHRIAVLGEPPLPLPMLHALITAAGAAVAAGPAKATVCLSGEPRAAGEGGAPVVRATWLFDSIAEHAVKPFAPYTGPAAACPRAAPGDESDS